METKLKKSRFSEISGIFLFSSPEPKTFKNLLLQNQKANGLGTWYVALGVWGLPSLFK